MNTTEIKKTFEQRRFNLIRTLDNSREEMELSKQHQIYGAIKELENILKTLDYYQEIMHENNFDFRLSSEANTPILKRITLKLMGKQEKEGKTELIQ